MQNTNKITEDYPTLKQDIVLSMVVVGAGAFSGFNIAKLAPALNLIGADYNLSLSQLGLLASLLSVMTVLLGMFIGALAPGFGPKRMLIAALITGCLGGFISLLGDSAVSLFIGRITEGFALITTMLIGPTLIGQHTHPKRRGVLMGLWGGFMPLGNGCALFLAPAMLSDGAWQPLWSAGVGAGVVLLLCVWRFIPQDGDKPQLTIDHRSVKQAVLMPALLICGLIFASHALIYQTLLQLLPLFLQEIGGANLSLAALVVGLFCALNFGGNVWSGRLLDRHIQPHIIVSAAYIVIGILIVLLASVQSSFTLLVMLLVPIAILTGVAPPILFYLASQQAPQPKQIPVFMAWMLQVQGLGMLLGPSVVSWIIESTQSWVAGFYAITIICLTVPLLAFSLRGLMHSR